MKKVIAFPVSDEVHAEIMHLAEVRRVKAYEVYREMIEDEVRQDAHAVFTPGLGRSLAGAFSEAAVNVERMSFTMTAERQGKDCLLDLGLNMVSRLKG
jgi:predicted transcriptional regulator